MAEITASAFVLAGTPPLHGRYLLPSDEQEQAAPVLLVGYDAWRRRFGADPSIVGRAVPLGGVQTTIVGIMPEGFAFPISEKFWTPLRLDPLKWRPWEGPSLDLFGRLAPDVSVEQAQAELDAIGRPIAAAHPDSAVRLQTALSFLVAINLAVLLYARTITRLGEIAVRTALGASRGRILSQLFVEAPALSEAGFLTGRAPPTLRIDGVVSYVYAETDAQRGRKGGAWRQALRRGPRHVGFPPC